MKYYSEELAKMFDSEDELLEAEYIAQKEKEEAAEIEKQKAEEKQRRFEEVQNAFTIAEEAHAKYEQLKNDYLRDYNSIRLTSNGLISWDSFWELFNR